MPWMALNVMGATLTEQGVRENHTACNQNPLLLSSAQKCNYI